MWVNLTQFLKGLWGILTHAIINYTAGNHNKIVSVSAEQIHVGQGLTIHIHEPVFLNRKGTELLAKRIEKELNRQIVLSAYYAIKDLTPKRKDFDHANSLRNRILGIPDADADGMSDTEQD